VEGIQSSEDGVVLHVFADDFPLEDRQILEKQLEEWDILIPGFVPPEPGILSLEAQRFAERDGVNILVLADRNLVTRWESIAKDGVKIPMNLPTQQAAYLMAFVQTANWHVEPSISFHELASHLGNEDAHRNLSWFRAADRSQRSGWIDIALGRTIKLPDALPVNEEPTDLAFPLDRWRMNYVVALKIAELKLQPMTPLGRMHKLLQWMEADFIFAGSALLFAALYFSPNCNEGGMINKLCAASRDKALAGVKNAAWDITYLGEFISLVGKLVDDQKQYVFATADRDLAKLAKLARLMTRQSDNEKIQEYLKWWPENDAKTIVQKTRCLAEIANRRQKPTILDLRTRFDKLTLSGEAFLREWRQNK
jgi:hypothetical protein